MHHRFIKFAKKNNCFRFPIDELDITDNESIHGFGDDEDDLLGIVKKSGKENPEKKI